MASLSAFCTAGCGGTQASTTVTTTSTGESGATGASGASGGTTTTPSPTPSPGPTPTPTPGPTPSPPPSAGDWTWTVEPSGRSEPIAAIWGSGPGDVWAVGGHGIVHSQGDGAWRIAHEDANESYDAVIGAGGWIFVGGSACSNGVCQGGVLLRSSDGGASWSDQSFTYAVSGLSAGASTIYADASDVYASSDDFATSMTVPLGWPVSIGVYADGTTLFAYGGLRNAELRRSSDGGQTWTSVFSGAYGSQSSTTNGLARGGATLFALANGCSVPSCTGALLRSADDGASWQEASRPQSNVAGVWAASDAEVFVGGSALMRSVDGGTTFAAVTLPDETPILALWGASANELYAVGQDGAILHGKRQR
ncbi:MAG TPA: hypothetical protein VGL86_15355 [Polyangia bacterium]